MARAKSVVLTPAEVKAAKAAKKQAVIAKKAEVKAANDAVKELTTFAKNKEKLHAASMKEHAKKLAAAQKAANKVKVELTKLAA